MDVKGIKLTNLVDFSNGGPVFCTGIRPDWEYIDGKPSANRIGTRYDVVFPAAGFAKATIKTAETKAAFTADDIICNGGSLEIIPNGFYATVYTDRRTNRAAFSLRAESITLLTK